MLLFFHDIQRIMNIILQPVQQRNMTNKKFDGTNPNKEGYATTHASKKKEQIMKLTLPMQISVSSSTQTLQDPKSIGTLT